MFVLYGTIHQPSILFQLVFFQVLAERVEGLGGNSSEHAIMARATLFPLLKEMVAWLLSYILGSCLTRIPRLLLCIKNYKKYRIRIYRYFILALAQCESSLLHTYIYLSFESQISFHSIRVRENMQKLRRYGSTKEPDLKNPYWR